MSETEVKSYSLGMLFTSEEFTALEKMWQERASHGEHRFAERVATEVVEPVIDRINAVTGQRNLPLYIAYMVEYLFNEYTTGGSYHTLFNPYVVMGDDGE